MVKQYLAAKGPGDARTNPGRRVRALAIASRHLCHTCGLVDGVHAHDYHLRHVYRAAGRDVPGGRRGVEAAQGPRPEGGSQGLPRVLVRLLVARLGFAQSKAQPSL